MVKWLYSNNLCNSSSSSRSKKLILETYLKHRSLVWKSYLSGLHKVRATNSFCVPIMSYGFGLIPWTKKEIVQFDVESRKSMTATCNHHPCSTVECLYLPRSTGGMDLINVENLFSGNWSQLLAIFLHPQIGWWKCVTSWINCCQPDLLLSSEWSAIVHLCQSHKISISVMFYLWRACFMRNRRIYYYPPY